ncbi:universal stress protein [Vibrio marisflavi]|uniref:Universal stress protein E n=1 Tax=Vibrio marisflavi CECT 7928 TaxID=634439 RepID=A0ABN8DWK8_9VIBR|nr:universal stress protein [Vibrio marisflavi]CAH0535893.1 Universal stress protein E [Vibrio marisflavi CECT 7928]
MKRFENILFATQGLPSKSDALDQSIRLAASDNVNVSGLIAFPTFPNELQQYQQNFQATLQNNLQQDIDSYRHQNNLTEQQAPFPFAVKSSEQPAICIIKEAMNNNIDLLIKEAEPIKEGGEGFKAVDMTLLRKCPCAVWLHRPTEKPQTKRRVAVAVDPENTDEQQRALSLRLLELSRSIADSCDSHLHIISCWEYYLEHYLDNHAWIHVEDKQLSQELEKAKDNHHQALQALIAESGVAGDYVIHHLHGKPDDAIPKSVEESEIDVLVMGTIARTGISGFVIGNTAENILQAINCSLVALKPEGFMSPVA